MLPCLAALLLAATPTQAPDLRAVPRVQSEVPTFVEPVSLLGAGRDLGVALSWPAHLDLKLAGLVTTGAIGSAVLLRYDVPVYRFIHQHVTWTARHHSIFNATLYLGDGGVDLGIVALFATGDVRARRVALEGTESLAAVALTSTALKHAFRVPRPQAGATQKRYFQKFSDDAFPSGHTMSAFAVATVISGEYPRAAPVAYGAASLVGLSVMMHGWHWPSDVILGAALGTTIGVVTRRANERWAVSPSVDLHGVQISSTF
jgi:membrane-associated phospholipid phosphatase